MPLFPLSTVLPSPLYRARLCIVCLACAFMLLCTFSSIASANTSQENTQVKQIQGKMQHKSVAFIKLEKKAQQGNATAQYTLGVHYDAGDGVAQDYPMAKNYYEQAAKNGHTAAQTKLGTIYLALNDGNENDSIARNYFRKAAKKGDAEAQVFLGILYSNGQRFTKDIKTSLKWFTKAAEQGHISGQYAVATLYYEGKDIPKDLKKALYWFTKAAKQNLPEAQFYTGKILAYTDTEKAMVWFKKAAEQSLPIAQFYFGDYLLYGQDIQTNPKEALEWYQKSLKQGFMPALPALVEATTKERAKLKNPAHVYGYILVLKKLAPNKDLQETEKTWIAQLSPEQIQEGQAFAKQVWKEIGEVKQ